MKDLAQGDEGYEVQVLQALLGLQGGTPMEPHGIFDNHTKLTVMQFQRLKKIDDVPGQVGIATWTRLLKGAPA